MSEQDRIRELYMSLTAAMTQFQKCLAAYIHEAEYPINYLMRDMQGKVSCAEMLLDGGPRVLLRGDEWEVFMPVEGNPVNFDLLEQWESKEIDKEIEYHNNQLNKLLIRKKEILAKQPSPLLCKANIAVGAYKVLAKFCEDNGEDFNTLTARQFATKYSISKLCRTEGCGKVWCNVIKEYLDSVGITWK